MTTRDAKGRFLKGHAPMNNGKGGRPKRGTEEQYLKRMTKIVTLADWDKVVHVAVARAKAGDAVARKWLSDYLIGMPVQKTEISGPDGGGFTVNFFSNVDDAKL